MAAKRLRDDSDRNPDKADDKRMRRLPSFSTVIREAMMRKSLQNMFLALEPLLRKVVQEEVERGIVLHNPRMLERPHQQMQIEAMESSSLKLLFRKQPFLPIFTGSKIEDAENGPLQILLVDACGNGQCSSPSSSCPPLKLELVVIDGDFPPDDRENWTAAEFQKAILKERNGKRPLLTGDTNVILRDGVATVAELQFTDNSSWVRSRHFRIGARVVPGSYDGPAIKQAMTGPFTVKDHRGELYKKHHPPYLGDEVWRLEKIGKDGAFHRKLASQSINTVQDFLKLLEVDPHRLREILGQGMSDRMWEVAVNHAKECIVGDKIYVHQGQQCTLFLNPICQVVKIVLGDMSYCSMHELGRTQKNYVQQLVLEAYRQWNTLEEADGIFHENIPLIQNESVVMHVESGSQTWNPDNNQEGAALHYQMQGFEEDEEPPENWQVAYSSSSIQWGYMHGATG